VAEYGHIARARLGKFGEAEIERMVEKMRRLRCFLFHNWRKHNRIYNRYHNRPNTYDRFYTCAKCGVQWNNS